MVCLHKKLVTSGKVAGFTWFDRRSSGSDSVGAWNIVPRDYTNGYFSNQFWAHGSHFEADPKNIYTLKRYNNFEPENINVALDKPVKQSSAYKPDLYPGSNAVDGNMMTFNHTAGKNKDWIEIDLLKVRNLNNMMITNCYGTQFYKRLNNVDVIFSETAFPNRAVDIKHYKVRHYIKNAGGIINIKLAVHNVKARYIRIQHRGSGVIHIGNIEVYGR